MGKSLRDFREVCKNRAVDLMLAIRDHAVELGYTCTEPALNNGVFQFQITQFKGQPIALMDVSYEPDANELAVLSGTCTNDTLRRELGSDSAVCQRNVPFESLLPARFQIPGLTLAMISYSYDLEHPDSLTYLFQAIAAICGINQCES